VNADPYRPPHPIDRLDDPADTFDAGNLSVYLSLPIWAAHTCVFRLGLHEAFSLKHAEDPSLWLGYMMFGNSEFGYWFSGVVVGLAWSELTQWWVRSSHRIASLDRASRFVMISGLVFGSIALTFGLAVVLNSN
jgi:hypothetical protein